MMHRISVSLILLGSTFTPSTSPRIAVADDTPPTSRPNAREAVETFVAAALVGEGSDTAALAEAGMSPESTKGIEEFRETLDVESLKIASVRASERKGLALAVSQPLKETDDTGRDYMSCVVFRLIRSEESWFLSKVCSMSQDAAGQETNTFNQDYPDAKEIVPVLGPDDVRSTSHEPVNHKMPDLQLLGVPSIPTTEYLAGTDVIVSWSEKGEWSEKADAVWGFCTSTCKWTKQELQPAAEQELAPLVSGSLAALQVAHAIYAYGAQTGRWDILRLPPDRKPQVSIHADMVLVTDGQDVYTFANSAGRWSSPEAAVPENLAAGKLAHELTIFYLKHAEAQSVSATLSQLFRELSLVADQRLNAIIVRSDSQEDLAKLEAVLKLLDQPIRPDQPDQPNQADRARKPTPEDFIRALRGGARAPARQQPAVPPRQPTPEDLLRAMRGGMGASARQQPATLREKYNELEQQAAQTAGQYRDLPDKATRGRFTAEALKRQLADTVKRAFEARQELQRAELAALCQRLVRIEQQIATRERIKDTIIDRRIEDLLNPEYRWDGDRESTFRSTTSAKVTQSQSPHAVTQAGDYVPADSKADAQIAFQGLEGARVTCSRKGSAASVIRLPGRIGVSSGQTMSFRLSDIPAHAGLELNGTIELPPIGAQTRTFLQHNVIPIEIHNEDVDQASSGNLVTKVIYLPKPEHQELALAGVETLVSTRLDPGIDPIAEAARRGHILATLRLGNRVPDDPPAATATSRDPADEPSIGPETKPDARAQQLLDVAQSRWEVLVNEYRGGKAELTDVLSAANELLEARLGVAQSAEARRAALRDRISLLKDQKTIAEAKYRGGVATLADVLLAQSALLKAERQLEAESSETKAQSAPSASSATNADSNANWVANMFSKTRCDLGVVAPGAKVQHRFVVNNPYVEDVHIASVRPTSNRIPAPQVTETLLKTHEKAEIVVEVDAGQAVGDCAETLTVVFDKPFRAEVTLGLDWSVREEPQLEPVEEEAPSDGKEGEDPAKLIWDTLGVKLRPLPRDELPTTRYRGGMQVTEIRKDSPAAEAKLRNDDIIAGIHHWETISVENVVFVLNHPDLQPKQNQPTDDIKVYVLRGDETLFATLRLADRARAPN